MWVLIIYYDRFWETFFPKMSDVMVQIFQKILTWKFNCISNLSKQNFFETNNCVQNRQVFSLYEINQQNLSTLGLYLKLSLYKILIFHGSVETDFTVSSKLLDMKMSYLCKSFWLVEKTRVAGENTTYLPQVTLLYYINSPLVRIEITGNDSIGRYKTQCNMVAVMTPLNKV